MILRGPSAFCNAFNIAGPWTTALPVLIEDRLIEGPRNGRLRRLGSQSGGGDALRARYRIATEGPQPMAPPLPVAVSGERIAFDSPAGPLSVYVAGNGPPLLLVHSVNAAASAPEVRPLHEHYRKTRTVYSPDLPGYGFSDRSDRAYTPRLMTDALHAVAGLIRKRCGTARFDALALSLSCEFLARAATEAPAHYRSLALVSPTGFSGGGERRGPAGSTREMPLLLKALRGPGWGGGLPHFEVPARFFAAYDDFLANA